MDLPTLATSGPTAAAAIMVYLSSLSLYVYIPDLRISFILCVFLALFGFGSFPIFCYFGCCGVFFLSFFLLHLGPVIDD